jgi:hypothetical protein
VQRPGRKSFRRKSKAESDAPGKAKAQGRQGRRPKGSEAAPEPGAESKDAAGRKVAADKPRLVALESIAEAMAEQDDDDEWHSDSDASGGSDVLWDVPFDAFIAEVIETLPMNLSATVVAVAEELAEIERLLALGGPPPRSAPLLLLSPPLASFSPPLPCAARPRRTRRVLRGSERGHSRSVPAHISSAPPPLRARACWARGGGGSGWDADASFFHGLSTADAAALKESMAELAADVPDPRGAELGEGGEESEEWNEHDKEDDSGAPWDADADAALEPLETWVALGPDGDEGDEDGSSDRGGGADGPAGEQAELELQSLFEGAPTHALP